MDEQDSIQGELVPGVPDKVSTEGRRARRKARPSIPPNQFRKNKEEQQDQASTYKDRGHQEELQDQVSPC